MKENLKSCAYKLRKPDGVFYRFSDGSRGESDIVLVSSAKLNFKGCDEKLGRGAENV